MYNGPDCEPSDSGEINNSTAHELVEQEPTPALESHMGIIRITNKLTSIKIYGLIE